MDRDIIVRRLFCFGFFIACLCLQLATGLPNIYNVYASRKGGGGGNGEEKPILAMANSPRCLYNGKPVANGFRVPNSEPCLNCTCNDGVLLCYLQTCPTLVVPSKDCHIGRAEGTCCPQIRCKNPNSPDYHSQYWNNKPKLPFYKYVPEELGEKPASENGGSSYNTDHLFVGSNHNAQYSDQFYNRFRRTSKTPQLSTPASEPMTTSRRRPQPQIQVPQDQEVNFEAGLPPEFDGFQNGTSGDCFSKGFKYSEGMAMLSLSKCEYCYCIRGQQMCVRPKCHLNIGGCIAKYQSGFTCCPSHYECELPTNGNDDNFASIENTIRVPAADKVSSCKVDGQAYEVGVAVASKGHCQTCYCTQVGIVCRRIECSPAVEGCKAIIPEGHCCPTEYECEDAASNRTKIPVSHSTDNYDVMVISPSENSSVDEDYVSEIDQDTNTSNFEHQDTTTERDRITIKLDQDSSVDSVSVLPEENIAVLVLTTDKESVEASTDSENRQDDITSGTIYATERKPEPSTLFSTNRYSPTQAVEDDTTSSERHTESATPGVETSETHSTITTTRHQEPTYMSNKYSHVTATGSEATSADDGDYYYEDYYPSEEYYTHGKLPAQVEVSAKETFAPFSDYDASDFHETSLTTQEHTQSTTEIKNDGSPTTQGITSAFLDNRDQSTYQGISSFSNAQTDEYHSTNAETLNYEENSKPTTETGYTPSTSYNKIESDTTISEKYIPSTSQTYTRFSEETQPSETTYNLQAQETFTPYRTDPTTTTQKRIMYTSLSTQTIPSTVTQRRDTDENTYYTLEERHMTSTEKSRTDEFDKYFSTNTDGSIKEDITDKTENSAFPQNTQTNTMPIEVAELILAITKSQSAKTDPTQTENTEYTETEPTPRVDAQAQAVHGNEESSQHLAMAAPKLIVEETTTKGNGLNEKTQPMDSTTNSNLLKYKSPLVVFSNHGPSAPIRPLSSVQTGMPSVVNNHKIVSNHSPSRPKPYRPTVTTTSQSPSTTAIEFSNHRPTNTFRRPPINKGQSRPGMVMKIGVQKPNPIRPMDGSYKNHRIASDSHDESAETSKDKENEKSVEENNHKVQDVHQLLDKPVSVSLVVDDNANSHSLKTKIQTDNSHTSSESISTTIGIIQTDDPKVKPKDTVSPSLDESHQSKSKILLENSESKDVPRFVANTAKSNFAPTPTSEPKIKQHHSGEETKLSRADDETHIKGLESPFVDRRLTSYGNVPFQRLPETKPKPHDPEIPQKEDDVQEIADVCFVDGRYYKSGEVIVKSNPCEMCRCFYGYPLCQVQQCPNPPNPSCMPEYLPGFCCPRITCGVKPDNTKLTDEVHHPGTQSHEQMPPLLTSDNQWKPLPNAYPQGTPSTKKDDSANAKQNKEQNVSNDLLKTPESSSVVKEIATGHVEKVPKVTIQPNKDIEISERITTLSPQPPVSSTEPNPVFKPEKKKDNTSSIHDNSSGVRKILNEPVVLPASKVSLSPINSSDIKTVLPLIHAIPTSAPDVQPNTILPVSAINDDAKSEISSEFGGNLKISGCNVYGQYYKINDKVSALSKPCKECVCSADGISCNDTC